MNIAYTVIIYFFRINFKKSSIPYGKSGVIRSIQRIDNSVL